MSRVGRKVIVVPASVKVSVSEKALEVQGPKGKLTTPVPTLLATFVFDLLMTACIGLFSTSTSAVKPRMPLRRAMRIRCFNRNVPMPWFGQSSDTAKATSARFVFGSR